MARKTIERQERTAAGGASRGYAGGRLIFVSGAILMALEIAGSRVLAPSFGGSVFVWGSLIGISLGAMSGGYWLGGWVSGRWPTQVPLNPLLAADRGFTLLLPPWAAPPCCSPRQGCRWGWRRPLRCGCWPGTWSGWGRRAASFPSASPCRGPSSCTPGRCAAAHGRLRPGGYAGV